MFRFTIRDVLWLMVVVGLVDLSAGCGRTNQRIETVKRGMDEVDKHAKEIEQASQP